MEIGSVGASASVVILFNFIRWTETRKVRRRRKEKILKTRSFQYHTTRKFSVINTKPAIGLDLDPD
jgi:hypothetical protein